MGLWIYPGSFDPVTRGHEDIIRRASVLCDQLIVAVLRNPDKEGCLPIHERTKLLARVCVGLTNVSVDTFSGLLAVYVKMKGASAVVRGLRGFADLEAEMPWTTANRMISPSHETVFLPASPETRDLSSGMVRQLALFGADIRAFVPLCIADDIQIQLENRLLHNKAIKEEKPWQN